MITNFNVKSISYRKIARTISFLLAYLILFKYPYISAYNLELVPQINLKELYAQINGLPSSAFVFNIGLVLFTISLIGNYIYNNEFYYKLTIEKEAITKIYNNYNFINARLDLTNPFLYTSKTKQLLE